MQLQIYTFEELFALSKAIVRSVTGVNYPFSEKTFHRALAVVQSLFAANSSKESIRLVKGGSLESLSGQLLDRRALENSVVRLPAQAARVAGRFVRLGSVGTAVSILPSQVVIRPATATQTELAFKVEAAALIGSADTESNLVYATCTETGEQGNVIPNLATLDLRNPITSVSHFKTYSASAGGDARETDDKIKIRARAKRRGSGEATWAGIESLLTTVSLSSGQSITSAKLFEAFDEPAPLYSGIVYAIIDDGSGSSTLVGPVDSTTYGFGGATWWIHESTAYDVYVQADDVPFELWDDGVNATLERDNGAGYVAQTEGTHYWVDSDRGVIPLATPLTVGQKVRLQFSFYTRLVKEAAKYVNGVAGSENIRGWRPVGYSVRIRPPQTVVKPAVTAGIVFQSGWDSTYGRALATTNVLAYLNGLQIGESARYDVIQGIIHKSPGVSYVSNLLLASGVVDVPVTHKYGCIRGDVTTIAF
jgi:hypothetical protein